MKVGLSNMRQIRLVPIKCKPRLDEIDPPKPSHNLVPVSCVSQPSLFNFTHFNAMQSESFDLIYKSDEDVVVSAPTASGKTTLMDLAILRLIERGRGTIVYLAPLKALCQERKKDWSERFRKIGLRCAEVTGDSDELQESPDLILATPEKWDSVTRKTRVKVRLLLVDEVHTLSQPVRGATLEAVISRMKTLAAMQKSDALRIVAISATVPNVHQVAEWLGARVMVFDSTYRPVPLKVKVLGYCPAKSPFHFEQNLNYRLTDVIMNYSDNKPTLVFCQTQKGTIKAAQHLAQEKSYIRSKDQVERLRLGFRSVSERALQDVAQKGVAFHHGGLSPEDREAVERMFLNGDLLILCTTSTLAVGVNLPAHLVVVKSTMGYRGTGEGYSEYSSLELLQMLGRAGRPQFDTSGVAVIMTEKQKVKHYEDLAEAKEQIDSALGTSMIEHLNAEIALGTISSLEEAGTWLRSTFFYVRQKDSVRDLGQLCTEHLAVLLDLNLVQEHNSKFHATSLGRSLAYNCVAVATVLHFAQALTPTSELIDLLLLISGSAELEQFSSKMDQRRELKRLNAAEEIKLKIKGAINCSEKKVFLLLQVALGKIPVESWDLKQQTTSILTASRRVAAVLLEFCDFKGFGRCLLNALILNKVLLQGMWPDEPHVLRQLHGIGEKYAALLAGSQIVTFEDVIGTEPWRLEAICNKNPPFGSNLKAAVQKLPQYSLKLRQEGREMEVIATPLSTQAEDSKFCLLALGRNDRVLCFRRLTLSSNQEIQSFKCEPHDLPLEVHLISTTYISLDYSAHFGKALAKQTSIDQFRKRVEPPQVTKDADYQAQSKNFDDLVLSHFVSSPPAESNTIVLATPANPPLSINQLPPANSDFSTSNPKIHLAPSSTAPSNPLLRLEILELMAAKPTTDFQSYKPIQFAPIAPMKTQEPDKAPPVLLGSAEAPKERMNLLDLLDESSEASPIRPKTSWPAVSTLARTERDEMDDLLADI
mmetsp:Transcript_13275/g.24901  ORF Transcript_13275/g.24901 Transcript_13275/m.24901 type:complete len:988 (+) Transcript_13275:2573-5536(+)